MPQDAKVDLRVQKTEQALLDAMQTLLETKPMSRITISDLCTAAKVRRATFYTHFQDKNDFLNFCLARKQAAFGAACSCGAPGDCEAAMRDMLRYFRENLTLLDCAGTGDTTGVIDLFAAQLMRMFHAQAAADQLSLACIAPPEIVATFFASAMLGVARWWLVEKPDISEEALVHHICALMAACADNTIKPTTKEGNHERKRSE